MPDTQPDGSNSLQKLQEKFNEAFDAKNHRVEFEFLFNTAAGHKLPSEVIMINVAWHNTNVFVCYIRDQRRLAEKEDRLRLQSNLLQAVNTVSAVLINTDADDYGSAVYEALRTLGQAASVDRSYIWESYEQDGKLFCRQLYEWSEGAEPQQGKDFTITTSYDEVPFWKDAVLNGKTLNMLVKDLPSPERETLEPQSIKSILIIPLFHNGQSWGFIGFDDCRDERTFAKEHEQVLRSGGALIVSNILRYRMIQSLVEAKETAFAHARAKSEFLSRVSHEIRTPMNAIMGMTRLAQKSDDIATVRRYLNTVEVSSEQLLDIINSMLDMSKIDAGKMGIEREEFDFDKMLKKVANIAQVKLYEKEIKFTIDCKQLFTRYVIGDERRIAQILVNLLDNAAKFTPAKGHVELKIYLPIVDGKNRPILRIEVSDNGCGIAPEVRGRIFQPFEQGDGSAVRLYGGTGLGLAICKHLSELMGGKIWVESEPGKGATFFVEIKFEWGKELDEKTKSPIATAVPAPADSAETTAPADDEPNYDFRGHCVLVAEDIEVNRKLMSLFLEETNIIIDNAENGVETVNKYKANPEKYSVILMDIQMPILDGLSATRQIRSSGLPNAKTIPIIAMTANAFKEDVDLSIEAGMNGHITKPIDIPELLKTLSEVMK
jgi:signal transduction histidine kinase/ActR/RegA family two-component response regulator